MTAVVQDGIRPSAMPRIMVCPGSVKAMAAMPPQVDNEHTELGKKRHEGMALMLRMGPVAGATKLAKEKNWTAEDIQVTGTAYKLAVEIIANYPRLEIEHEVNVEFLGIRAGERRVDVAGYNPLTKTALVLDWKFGVTPVDDPEVNWQELTYAPGWVAELINEGMDVVAVELVIVQPRAYKKDDQCRSHTMPIADIRANALKVLGQVKLARTDDAPRVPEDKACFFCTFKDQCPERLGAEKQKVAGVKAERQELVQAGTPIIVEANKDYPLAMPLVIISEELVAKVDALCAQALAIKVTDLKTAEAAGQMSKDIRKLNSAIEAHRKERVAPLVYYKKQADEAPKVVTTKLTAADDYLQGEGQRFLAAEVAKQAELDRKQRELEQAQRVAEEERQRAERARKPENQAAATQAAEEAQARVEQLTLQTQSTPAPVLSFTGFKAAPTISLFIEDITKIPPLFMRQILVIDERKVAKMLVDGLLVDENVKGWGIIQRGTTARRK